MVERDKVLFEKFIDKLKNEAQNMVRAGQFREGTERLRCAKEMSKFLKQLL